MVKNIKKILFSFLILNICFFIIWMFASQAFVIKGFTIAYPICGIIISTTSLIIFLEIRKIHSEHRISMVFVTFGTILISLLSCCLILGMKKQFREDERYYDVYVEGLSESETITLFEYNAFLQNCGCLCIKVNNYIYKITPNTFYCIDSGYSLSKQESLILDYNPKDGTLNMKYRINENEKYIEKTIPLKK